MLVGRASRSYARLIVKRMIKWGCLGLVLAALLIVIGFTGFAWIQAKRTPSGKPVYVALGSSFAAGAGLGPLQSGSPLLCARSKNGYPRQLARMRGLPLVDMSCGGAVARHLLHGGQFFQGPQIRVIGRETRLVTITVGGNDVGYVGDLQMLAARRSNTLLGWLVRHLWNGPAKSGERDFATLNSELLDTIRTIHALAPKATIVVATYPAILPPSGTCPQLNLSAAEVEQMRKVGDQLAETSRAAAKAGGAILVDMHRLGAAHSACSSVPWTNGATALLKAPFHPTLAGAKATAKAISRALDHQQL